uniref:Ig-like domain-containing protein n=1 Tax=Pygocentrus nattereri TaxID=42514 RepID=A0A3B4DV37_PYGNA
MADPVPLRLLKISRYIFVFYLLLQMCATYSVHAVNQDQLKIAEAGDSIHLSCFSSRDTKTTIVWIKQNSGEKPVVIATSYQHQPGIFQNGFDQSGRFETQTAAESFNLTISNLEPSDTATYYCTVIFFYDITFGEGTFLVVKDASLTKHRVHQHPVLEAFHPGDSVTLQCSVLTESCSGDHSVYWLRHGSGESHPGIICTHGNRSDECKKSSETDSPTQSCVYKLPKRNLSLSDAGTYYCAVAACGQIIIGNGTQLDVNDSTFWIPTVVALAASNMICLCVTVILGGLLCKYQQKSAVDDSQLNQAQVEERDTMNYASLGLSQRPPTTRRTGEKMNQDQSLYARVKIHEQE